jgi:hypothetical protein
MEHVCTPAEDDVAAVKVGDLQGWVRLWNRTHPYQDEMVAFCVELGGLGLSATVRGIEAGEQMRRLAADLRELVG